MSDRENIRLLEALLFASSEPSTEKALAKRLPDGADVSALLEDLRAHYAERGVNLMKAGNAWAFRTNPELAVRLVKETKIPRKLGRATVETLAIIAYHQPVTRSEIEEIRGVSLHRRPLDVLLEAGWIRPRGHRRTPGRPMTWGTTDGFLDHFGLEALADLPGRDDLKAAGLLDSGPAIDAYRIAAPANTDEAEGDLELLPLAEGGDDPLLPDDGPEAA